MNQTKLFARFSTDFGFQKIKNIPIKTLFLAVSLLLVSANILPGATPGILDTSFNETGIQTTSIGNSSEIFATAVQPDGKIVATGSCSSGGDPQLVVTRYNIDGSLDLTFNTTGQSFFSLDGGVVGYGIAVQDDGKIETWSMERDVEELKAEIFLEIVKFEGEIEQATKLRNEAYAKLKDKNYDLVRPLND